MTARPASRVCSIVCALGLATLLVLGGCASTPNPPADPLDPVSAPPATATLPPNIDPDPDPAATAGNGPTAAQRAQTAVEGMLVGAVIGAPFGPIGSAGMAGAMLVYSAITGQVPFHTSGGGGGGGGRWRLRRSEQR